MQTETYLITVTLNKPVNNLPELIGSRAWSITGVEDVTVQPVELGQTHYAVTPTGPAV